LNDIYPLLDSMGITTPKKPNDYTKKHTVQTLRAPSSSKTSHSMFLSTDELGFFFCDQDGEEKE